jgi:tripartite-type tricarboxylate transporter receptor subunit TctC
MNRREFLRRTGSVAVALAGPAAPAWAQAYPDKTVTIAVPFSGGSMTDVLARAIGQKLGSKWGQTVVVENRPGIGGTAGIAKAPADGYTLMLTSNGHTVIKAVNPDVAFDPITDFIAVTKVATTPLVLIVPKNSPAKNVRELAELAKSAPDGVNFASAGRGSATGIAAELFRKIVGAKMTMVPFRGLPEANTAVLRGDVAFAFTFYNVGGELIRNGDLRALAVTSDARMTLLPDVPTFKEAGFAAFEYDAWFGILVPAGTPANIVQKLDADIAAALADAELRQKFEPQGVVIAPSSPTPFAAQMRDDAKRFGELIAGNPR